MGEGEELRAVDSASQPVVPRGPHRFARGHRLRHPGAQPVYHLYNDGQGAAPNHRYATSLAVRSDTMARGWIAEGYGDVGVIMCAPL